MSCTTSEIDPRQKTFIVAEAAKWYEFTDTLVREEIVGHLMYRKVGQDIYVRLQYFGYEAEVRVTNGLGMLPDRRLTSVQNAAKILSDGLKRQGAYGILEKQWSFIPTGMDKITPLEKPKAKLWLDKLRYTKAS